MTLDLHVAQSRSGKELPDILTEIRHVARESYVASEFVMQHVAVLPYILGVLPYQEPS